MPPRGPSVYETFNTLDALSKLRALSTQESYQLERAVKQIDKLEGSSKARPGDRRAGNGKYPRG